MPSSRPHPQPRVLSRVGRRFPSHRRPKAQRFTPWAETLEQRLELSGADGINFGAGTVVHAGQTVTVSIQLSFTPYDDGAFVYMSDADQAEIDGQCCGFFEGPISYNPGYFPAEGYGVFVTDQHPHTLTFNIDPGF